MSTSREVSRSFSSQSVYPTSTRPSERRKTSRYQQAQHNKHRLIVYDRSDVHEEIDEHLCDRCRTIDFEAIFGIEPDGTVTEQGVNVYDLGQVAPYSKDTSCKLCVLFAQILIRDQQYASSWQGDWYLRAFTTGTVRNRSHAAVARAQDLSIVIALSKTSDSITKQNKIECIDRGVIMPWYDVSDPSPGDQGVSRIISCPRRIDFNRIQDMLLSCDSDHMKCKERQENAVTFPVRARVIDCENREIVPLTLEHTYLALSYVWGAKSPQDLPLQMQEGSTLSESLPSTIEDAISITKALGLRYLWVDRMCIDQSQSDDTRDQLAQMGNLYSHAYATICALGEHDDIGFPGFSFPRKKQLRVRTQDLILSWTGPSLRRSLDFSEWRNRGWTYQESVLSRRCLFFTDYFVALVCDSDTSTENISFIYSHVWSFNRVSEIYGDATGAQVLYPAQQFDKHLQEFQRRQLSYVTDTLNAFKGILSQLSVQSYWGIPIYKVVLPNYTDTSHLYGREQETGFIAGLCWKITKSRYTTSPNRDHLPSWSWAGQTHALAFTNCLAGSRHLEVSHSYFSLFQASIRIKHTNGNLVTLQDLSQTYPTTNLIPEQTKFLEIRSITIRWQRHLPAQRKLTWTHTGLAAYQTGENGWWRSDIIGDLHLDPSYDDLEKPHEKCTGSDEVCRHLTMKDGVAVLLALDVQVVGNRTSTRAVWLVVKQVRGGSYLRRGVIVSRESVKDRKAIVCPTEDMLETILLG